MNNYLWELAASTSINNVEYGKSEPVVGASPVRLPRTTAYQRNTVGTVCKKLKSHPLAFSLLQKCYSLAIISLALKGDNFCQAVVLFWLKIMKDIEGYEGLYAVTEDGKVWSYRNKKFLITGEHYQGYRLTALFWKGKGKTIKTHRLVAMAFIPNPLKLPAINHKNGIKDDNRVENLEWCTNKQNSEHAIKLGLIKKGTRPYTTGKRRYTSR